MNREIILLPYEETGRQKLADGAENDPRPRQQQMDGLHVVFLGHATWKQIVDSLTHGGIFLKRKNVEKRVGQVARSSLHLFKKIVLINLQFPNCPNHARVGLKKEKEKISLISTGYCHKVNCLLTSHSCKVWKQFHKTDCLRRFVCDKKNIILFFSHVSVREKNYL